MALSGEEAKWSKILTRKENGDLHLLEENLTKVVSEFAKIPLKEPIAVLSCLGSKCSENSVFSSLAVKYLIHGRHWVENSGEVKLAGFTLRGSIAENEDEDGVYVWQDLLQIKLNTTDKIHVWILHVCSQCEDGGQEATDKLKWFAAMACSLLIDVYGSGEKSEVNRLLDGGNAGLEELKQHLCSNVLFIERGSSSKKILANTSSPVREVFSFPLCTANEELANTSGHVQFSAQECRSVEKVFIKLKDAARVKVKIFNGENILTIENITKFLEYYVNLANMGGCGGNVCTERPQITLEESRTADVGLRENLLQGELDRSDVQTVLYNPQNQPDSDDSMELLPKNVEECPDPVTNVNKDELVWGAEILSRSTWTIYERFINKRIANDFSKEKIRGISTLGNLIAQDFIDEERLKLASNGLPLEKADLFVTRVVEQIDPSIFRENLFQLQEELHKYCSEIEMRMENARFGEVDVHAVTKATVEEMTALMSPAIKDLFEVGAFQLKEHYEDLKMKMSFENKQLMDEVRKQIRERYRLEMKHVLSAYPKQRPILLSKINERLSEKLLHIFTEVLHDFPGATAEREILRGQLCEDFVRFETENICTLKFALLNLNREIAKFKSKYEIAMESILVDHPDGIEPAKYTVESEKIQIEVIACFMTNIDSNLRELYLFTLKQHLQNSEIDFLQANKKLWSVSHHETGKNPEKKDSGKMTCPTTKMTNSSLIILQFGYKNIVFARNKDGELNTERRPFEITLTQCGKWICGTKRDEMEIDLVVKKFWNLCELLQCAKATQLPETVILDTQIVEIRIDFLISIYLKSLGLPNNAFDDIQKFTLIIIVPSCYSSFQRQLILNAAEIIDLELGLIQILNEEFLSAYHLFDSKVCVSSDEAIILYQNAGVVGITAYRFNHASELLLIVGSFYETCEYLESFHSKHSDGWFKVFGYLLDKVKSRFGSKDDALRQNLKVMIKGTMHNADQKQISFEVKYTKLKFLICAELERYATEMTETVKTLESDDCQILLNNYFAVQGAYSVFKNNCEKGRDFKSTCFTTQQSFPFHVNILSSHYKFESEHYDEVTSRYRFVFPSPRIGSYRLVERRKFARGETPSGTLNLRGWEMRQACCPTSMTFARSRQGILELKTFRFHEGQYSGKTGQWVDFPTNFYDWRGINIDSQCRLEYSRLLRHIQFYIGTQERMEKGKREVVLLGNALINAINQNQGKFNRVLVKTMVLNEINGILEAMRSKEITEEDLNQKRILLENISLKYNLRVTLN